MEVCISDICVYPVQGKKLRTYYATTVFGVVGGFAPSVNPTMDPHLITTYICL